MSANDLRKTAKYYLVVSQREVFRAGKLRDCASDQIELAECEAIEEWEKRQAQGNEDAIVRIIEESTNIVVFAVHKGNVDSLK